MRNGMRSLLICAIVAIAWSTTGVTAAPPVVRSYAASNFFLELDGIQVGAVSSVEGGLAFGDVVKLPGDDFFFKKHLGNAGFRDIRFEIGAGLDKSFYAWLAASLEMNYLRKDGAIVGADFNGNVLSRLEFTRALITEVTFPAVDANSKEAARMSIVLTPDETVLNRKASGKLGKSATSKKAWLTSNFRFSIDGLEDATKRVTKVEALTVKLPHIGDCFKCEEAPPTPLVDFPHVVMTIGEPADAVYDWFDDFVIKGNNSDEQERGGTLEYLTPDGKTPLFTLRFKNLGIFELMPVVEDGAAAQIRRLLAAMYCESIEFVAQ